MSKIIHTIQGENEFWNCAMQSNYLWRHIFPFCMCTCAWMCLKFPDYFDLHTCHSYMRPHYDHVENIYALFPEAIDLRSKIIMIKYSR